MPEQIPDFLGLELILDTHTDLLKSYGGSAGIRDMGMLQSALAMPQAQFGGQFLHGDIYEMAAAYVFHLVQNHPFVDGNKRIGAAAGDIFLALNGFELEASEKNYEMLIMGISQGNIDKSAIAKFFRENTTPSK